MRRLLPGPAAELDDAGLVDAYRLPPGPRRCGSTSSPRWTARSPSTAAARGSASPGDQRVFRTLRALADVVLVGARHRGRRGLRAGDGGLPPSAGCAPRSAGRATAPIAVVSRRASLDPGRPARRGSSPTLLVTCAAADAGRRAALAAAGVDVLVCGRRRRRPAARARPAGRARASSRSLCEGGPQLLRAALAAGVVDELDLSIAPALVGGGDAAARRAALAGRRPARPAAAARGGRRSCSPGTGAGGPLGSAGRPVADPLGLAPWPPWRPRRVSRTVVSRLVTAPPLPIARTTAAMDTLSGASHRLMPSCEPKAYQNPCSFPPTDSM